jgi:hypothetical protein
LRTGSTVFDVAVNSSGVEVMYEDKAGGFRAVRAKAAVLCCPKFVAQRIVLTSALRADFLFRFFENHEIFRHENCFFDL